MRIGIDCRELRGQAGGFRSYLAGLLSGLAAIDDTNEYLLYVPAESSMQGFLAPRNSVFVPLAAGRLISDWARLPKRIRSDSPDVVHFPCNYGLNIAKIPTVISLLDCICLDGAFRAVSMRSRLVQRYSALMTRRSVPKADRIITISEYARRSILRHFLSLEARVVVTHLAGVVGLHADPQNRCAASPGAANSPYFLVLASVDPRKNVDIAIRAFSSSQARNRGWWLLVVASHPAAAQMIRKRALELGIQDSLRILTSVDDQTLLQLYRDSEAFVFPSLDEGFGLPPLEAMACGTAVLSSDRASMPEVLGDAALYFDPLDSADLSKKMNRVVDEDTTRTDLREAGLRMAARYSWEKTARSTLDVYEQAARLRLSAS